MMKIAASAFALLALLAVPAAAQSFPRHNFTFAAGGAEPQSDLANFMQTAPGVGISYGYRFMRNFQADLGLDILFGGARIRDFVQTDIGDFRIKDREYFVPMGGRAIIPLGRLQLHAGGGGAYMKYDTRVSQPSSYFRIDCSTCTSRSGWGYYAQAGAEYFLTPNIRLGLMTRVYRGHTDGDPLGPVPGIRTRDQWINTMAQIGFSF